MQRFCANIWCCQPFEVTNDDLAFYEKVSPIFSGKKELIPPPTRCPECRMQRRLGFRNERSFYQRVCDTTGRDIIALYAADKPYTVYNQEDWWGDGWDPMQYGQNVDFSRPFFDQFRALWKDVPMLALWNIRCENSTYGTNCYGLKNCYMCINSDQGQNNLYGYVCEFSNNCVDCAFVHKCELCYEVLDCINAYQCSFSERLENCQDCSFCSDLIGCSKCFECHGLRHKTFHIFNRPVSQEEWNKYMSSIALTSQILIATKKQSEALRLQTPHLYARIIQCENSSGDYLYRCKNAMECFDVTEAEDVQYLTYSPWGAKNARDIYACGEVEWTYDFLGGAVGIHTVAFSTFAANGLDNSYYCVLCVNGCSHLFGCIGVRKREYCILNKQYTKEEYERLVPKIIEKMRADGEWGEFFPVELSPFAYNETVAQEYFPLTKEEVFKRGWKWRDEVDEIPKVSKIIPAERLPDSIDQIPNDILNWAIKCEATGRPFKIVKQELAFYRKMKLPIPHFHPDERHRRRMTLRNPRKLWKRPCGKCGKEMETTYSPERPEKVYCEECYLKEVY